MSKQNLEKHIVTAQKQLLKIKEKGQKYVPGTIDLQILGCGTAGAPASIYLFTDQSRYLFNCGEGTQRLAHEHKTKLTRLEHIFVTQRSWQCIGGLPGLSLTIQDAGVPHIALHGPPKLIDVYHGMRKFVVLKQLQVDAPECKANEFYDDAVLSVYYLPLCDDDSDASGIENSSVMAFLCKCKPRPGTLSFEKCQRLGVPKGPLLGRLKNGETLTLENGTIVRPEDVKQPDDPGPIFLVVDIPSIGYLKNLRRNTAFKEYLNENLHESNRGDLVIHFTPPSVIDTNEYREFIESFSKSTKHLVLNEDNKFSGFVASHRLQWQLNQVNKDIFPILKEPIVKAEPYDIDHCTKKIKLNDSGEEVSCETKSLVNLEYATSMTCYHLRPKNCIDRSLECRINPDDFIKEIMDIDGVPEALKSLKEKQMQLSPVDRCSQYPKIVFLGTGSCIPNKTRNVSSILIHTSKDTCLLLDAGEGSCGQIFRFYGDEAHNVISKIKAIFISHLHADHHIGLFGIIQKRKQLHGDKNLPILLIAPNEMWPWLTFYDNEVEPIATEFEFVANRSLMEESLPEERLRSLGICALRTCGVVHCPNAFAISLTINQQAPFKITYSGDTKPCDALVELGMDSTLLIHEATMEDELFEDALAKMHSTVSQAIEQGHKMNAKSILLTHFSQRYAKIPRIEQHLSNNVGIAFDNMEVVPSDLKNLNELYPAMKKMFSEHWDEMQQKSQKRAHKKAVAQQETEQ